MMNVAGDSDVKFLTKLLKFAPNSFLFSSAHGLKLQSTITKAHSCIKCKMSDSIPRGLGSRLKNHVKMIRVCKT